MSLDALEAFFNESQGNVFNYLSGRYSREESEQTPSECGGMI